jgi:hypothetical protein
MTMPAYRLSPVVLALAACATAPRPATQAGPERPWQAIGVNATMAMARNIWLPATTPLTEDLGLAIDSGSGDDSAITHLLSVKIVLPAHVQVGVLQLGAMPVWWDQSSPDAMTQSLADSVAQAVSRASRVSRVSILPTLIVGQHPSVSRLREGAARMQADVLLVYRPGCRLYDRQPFIGSTEYRAVCTLEAAVLDTRSGLIPFSTVVTSERVTKRIHREFDDAETMRRAQLEAVTEGLQEVAKRLGTFLENVPSM